MRGSRSPGTAGLPPTRSRSGQDGRLLVAGAARRAVADVNTGLVARLQPDLPPAAALTAPAQARVGQAVTFDASGSSDPEGALFRFVWDFDGDGRDDADSGARPTASHTFARPGRVTARVRVIDEAGSTAPESAVLTVGEATGGGESAGNVAPNRVIVRVLSGHVRVRRPGAARFSRLSGRVSVPFRTEIDARKGVVRLTVAAAAGGTQVEAPCVVRSIPPVSRSRDHPDPHGRPPAPALDGREGPLPRARSLCHGRRQERCLARRGPPGGHSGPRPARPGHGPCSHG